MCRLRAPHRVRDFPSQCTGASPKPRPTRNQRSRVLKASSLPVIAGPSDDEVGRKFADLLDEDLLESGVQVYERRARMIHAKTVVIDCVWSTVGSTNMDLWSFVRDNEINVVVIETDFADQLEELFEEDIAHSNQITKEQWSKRPLIDRAKEFFCVLFSHWL